MTTPQRETVLDRRVSIRRTFVRDVPDVPRLCDGLDVTRRHVDVGGCRLYCELAGKGTPVVLVHGGPGSTHHLFHPAFSRASAFAKVVYYDQRGCGLSDYKKGGGYTVDQAVADLDALRKALRIGRWVVLGHSYGGLLAQCYALKYPRRAAGLVLVCALPGMDVPLKPTRQFDYLSPAERKKIRASWANESLTDLQRLYNAHLNGDWKRQSLYKPSEEDLARKARYEWVHAPDFRRGIGPSISAIDLTGAFDGCPIPTLILEAKWDLTWNTDKLRKLHANHPAAKLVILQRSGHGPFDDEPERFFAELRRFVEDLPTIPASDVTTWRKDVAEWRARQEASPAHLLRSSSWGRRSSRRIAVRYRPDWLERLAQYRPLLRLGFALYDVKRYDEALAVFRELRRVAGQAQGPLVAAMVWEGHMLDLLGRRAEAVRTYAKVAAMGADYAVGNDQYGLSYSPSAYAKKRVKSPFERIENKSAD